jgi:SAM-dependent methyltransferase
MTAQADVAAIYARRFDDEEQRREMWEVLCTGFFQRYVPAGSTVLEIGAGYCEFINTIRARRKLAVDLNPDTVRHAAPDVTVITTASSDLSAIPAHSIDVAFTSNFFEHLSREDIVGTLREAARVLGPHGRLLVLQPNIRFCARDYWMFFDHVTPLDDRSLSEALETNGFRVTCCIPRFLPYTTKSKLPRAPWMIRAYLACPLAWRVLGAQTFVEAVVTPHGSGSRQ